MRITAKAWAAAHGLSDRAVRSRLQRGTLQGIKERDPESGVEVWWIDVPDDPERRKACIPDRPDGRKADVPDRPVYRQRVVDADSEDTNSAAIVAFREMVAQLHRENVELAGRCGFYQSEIQQLRTQLERAETRILELESPKEAPTEMANHPAHAQNVPDSGSLKLPSRPWWQFWR